MNTQLNVKRTLAISSFAALATLVASQSGTPAGVAVSVKTNKAVYDQGELVTFNINLVNRGKTAVKLNFPNGQRFDLTIQRANADSRSARLWRWSDGRAFNMMYSTVQLEAGK